MWKLKHHDVFNRIVVFNQNKLRALKQHDVFNRIAVFNQNKLRAIILCNEQESRNLEHLIYIVI